MSRKRRNTSSPEPDDELPSKRHDARGVELDYDSDETETREAPRFDDLTGQTGAFPGLGGDSDELFYGPASDGIDYLRMVRSEAKGVPHVLTRTVAGTQEVENGGDEDGGYYYDDAYTAIKDTSAIVTVATSFPRAQARYYDSLLAQFRLLQATLRCSPPLSAVETLAPAQFISFPESTRKVRSQWEKHILSTDPHPVQLACMSTHTVIELVRFLVTRLPKMLRKEDQVGAARAGAWVWGILGKCPDRAELGNEEIGELRELAQVALRLQEGNFGAALDGDEDNMEGDDEHAAETGTVVTSMSNIDEDASVEKVDESDMNRRKLLSTALDMIVTIVGEVYGQRDLLDLRKVWPDET